MNTYDLPEYDVFRGIGARVGLSDWQSPRTPDVTIEKLLYAQRPGVIGNPRSFAICVSPDSLGLCSEGVFDRYLTFL